MSNLVAAGIDLGTTYSAIAVMNDHGAAELVPNADSERLTASAVFFDDDAIVVGQIARDAALTNPDRVAMFVKRQMGNSAWFFSHEGQRYSPVEISAMILTRLKEDAEKYLNSPIRQVVITVPAYFDEERRRATIAAGELAGLQVLGLVNEPTAAAIAYGIDRSATPETVLVYDLGGGTFDATLLRIEGRQIRIIATRGDYQLGGKDFDDAIMRHSVAAFCAEHGVDDPTLDSFVAGELRVSAEKAKRELSRRLKTTVLLRAPGKTTRVAISRQQFEELIKPKLDTALALVRILLRDAGVTPQEVDRVLLVGGSTRIPCVSEGLAAYFGKQPDDSVNPDEAVALGAAVRAAHILATTSMERMSEPIAEKVGGLQITDVTSHSFGIEAMIPGTNRRVNAILIPRNTPLPAEVSKEFVTSLPGQTAIELTIYQGESQDPALCNAVGEFTMGGLPPNRPAGCKVRVTVGCNVDGVVNVTAQDIETGKQTTREVAYKTELAPTPSARARWKKRKPIV